MLRTRSGSTFGLATFGGAEPDLPPCLATQNVAATLCVVEKSMRVIFAGVAGVLIAGMTGYKLKPKRLPWAIGLPAAYLWALNRKPCKGASPDVTQACNSYRPSERSFPLL